MKPVILVELSGTSINLPHSEIEVSGYRHKKSNVAVAKPRSSPTSQTLLPPQVDLMSSLGGVKGSFMYKKQGKPVR